MSVPNTITLADGQSTPVNHDFDPTYKSGGQVVYFNRDSQTSVGSPEIRIGFSPRTGKRPTDRLNVSVAVPYEYETEVGSGVFKVQDVARYNGQYVIAQSLPKAVRDDLQAYVSGLAAHAVMQASVKDLDPPA